MQAPCDMLAVQTVHTSAYSAMPAWHLRLSNQQSCGYAALRHNHDIDPDTDYADKTSGFRELNSRHYRRGSSLLQVSGCDLGNRHKAAKGELHSCFPQTVLGSCI